MRISVFVFSAFFVVIKKPSVFIRVHLWFLIFGRRQAMRKCLYCYEKLAADTSDFHPACSRKIFGVLQPPELPYTRADIDELAKQNVRSRTTIAGVQPKISLAIEKAMKQESRLTIVGLGGAFWGTFILKLQTVDFPHLPENEDITMHLAEIAGLPTVPHSLVRFRDGELCYITRRIDRSSSGAKIAMEDMCQLAERMSADKYKSSHEQIAKVIQRYSAVSGFDLVSFAELTLFSWLTGNSDMHLKNFSLVESTGGFRLAPAYDLLNVRLAMPSDKEELALPHNGKKARLRKGDFEKAFRGFGIPDKVVQSIFVKMAAALPRWLDFLPHSFLPTQARKEYASLLQSRVAAIQ